MKLSLCIPTMDRWSFLKDYLPKYITYECIDEIVITDENGNDAKLIKENFDNPKIKVFVNEKRLGAFLNKERVVSLATNEFVCLMDSDNFAPLSYFEAFYKYLNGNEPNINTVFMPTFSSPQHNHGGLNYRALNGLIFDKTNFKDIYRYNNVIFNTGNYIVSKTAYKNSSLNEDEHELANTCKAVDVLFKNYLLLTRANVSIIMVPDMGYDHIVHDGSYYLETHMSINMDYFHSMYR